MVCQIMLIIFYSCIVDSSKTNNKIFCCGLIVYFYIIFESIFNAFYLRICYLLALMKQNNLLDDPRCQMAINIIKQKKRKDGYWQVDKTFMKSSWIEFDLPKRPGFWITNYIDNLEIEKS